MQVVRELKFWINAYNNVKAAVEELQLAFDFTKEGIVSEEEVDANYTKAISLIEDLELKTCFAARRTNWGLY